MVSLIIMLPALVAVTISMGSLNIFSNAMATEIKSDKNDNSPEYESYYSDDNNKYKADYNNNYDYSPMKQQQQQLSYENNYGYDNGYNDKRISYSNSYEDMKKFSTYPTKDKKYACQAGQFEGFFVESVEFCKLKIPQGPRGEQGPPGADGTEGE